MVCHLPTGMLPWLQSVCLECMKVNLIGSWWCDVCYVQLLCVLCWVGGCVHNIKQHYTRALANTFTQTHTQTHMHTTHPYMHTHTHHTCTFRWATITLTKPCGSLIAVSPSMPSNTPRWLSYHSSTIYGKEVELPVIDKLLWTNTGSGCFMLGLVPLVGIKGTDCFLIRVGFHTHPS